VTEPASSIPVIDLASADAAVSASADAAASDSADAAALALHVDAALRSAGFFAITGHAVPAAVTQAAFDASHRFFALPQTQKERWHINRSGHQRGFDPIGWQALDPTQAPDLKESFYMGVEQLAPNQWPDETLLPAFRAACEAYAQHMRQLAQRLMALFELALRLPAGHFNSSMQMPQCTTRLLHYPPQPASTAPGQLGCGAHTDWGALTLLAQDDAGGLQVQRNDGAWMDVPPMPGALIVNIGDMMQRWTNDRWRSAPHRVINPRAGHERWSIAYFFDLDVQAVITPLPSCVDAAHPPRYAAITAGEHLREMLRRTTVVA
jgi:isopenicillin N synthase-like dioxygenase